MHPGLNPVPDMALLGEDWRRLSMAGEAQVTSAPRSLALEHAVSTQASSMALPSHVKVQVGSLKGREHGASLSSLTALSTSITVVNMPGQQNKCFLQSENK